MTLEQLRTVCEEAVALHAKDSPGLIDRQTRIVQLAKTFEPRHDESPYQFLRRLDAQSKAPSRVIETTEDALVTSYRRGNP